MSVPPTSADVIVMGAGPAGSAVASILARKGRRVVVFEKETFPRHHIGESLIPMNYWVLKRMGALDKIKSAGFTKKFSVQFSASAGKASKPFYFFETNHHESAVTWQVDRAKFDKILLDHARECGAEVHEATAVKDVLFEGDRAVGVVTQAASSHGSAAPRAETRAPVTVDATGLNALLGGKLGLRVRDPKLRKASVYGYFRGARRDAGIDEGATLILRTPDALGWFWYLPMADDVTSVGVVNEPDRLFTKARGRDYEKILMEEIESCPAVRERLAEATRVQDVHTISDFSYRTKRCAGPGWVLVGDAFGFLDPVYSSGVYLALRSGEMAADCIEDAFAREDFSAARLGAFGPALGAGVESFRKLLYAFYTKGFSFGKFMRANPQYRRHLIDLLVGDVIKHGVDDIFDPMAEVIDLPQPLFGSPANSESMSGEMETAQS